MRRSGAEFHFRTRPASSHRIRSSRGIGRRIAEHEEIDVAKPDVLQARVAAASGAPEASADRPDRSVVAPAWQPPDGAGAGKTGAPGKD